MVVVVIPTYMEAENVRWLLPRLLDSLEKAGWRALALIVDDSSPDGTAEVAEEIGSKRGGGVEVLKRPKKLGIGSAYIDGFRHALMRHPWAKYICEMDADGSHPPETLVKMLEYAERLGADVVVASRYIEGGGWVDGSLTRVLISRSANLLARISTGIKLSDLTSGFRAIRAESLRKVVDKLTELRSGYVFQVQLLYLLSRADCKIVEYPLKFMPRRSGESKLGKNEIISYAEWCIKTFFRRILD